MLWLLDLGSIDPWIVRNKPERSPQGCKANGPGISARWSYKQQATSCDKLSRVNLFLDLKPQASSDKLRQLCKVNKKRISLI